MTPFRQVTPATGSIPVIYKAPFALEADRNAVQMMAAAGYDPSALLDYVSRTVRERGAGGADRRDRGGHPRHPSARRLGGVDCRVRPDSR